MAIFLELPDQLIDNSKTDPHLLSHIFPKLLQYQYLMDYFNLFLQGKHLPLFTQMPRHRWCFIDKISEIGVLQVLRTSEVAPLHLLRQDRHIMNILVQYECILPMPL